MLLLVIAVIVFVAGFVITTAGNKQIRKEWEREKRFADEYKKEYNEPIEKIAYPRYIGIGLAVILIIVSCIAIVPTGYTGILTSFGAVENRTVNAGINFIAPWQKVVKMDSRTQKVPIETSAFSSDIQQVDLIMSVNYCISQTTAREIYKTVGKNYFDNIMQPRIQENTKAVFSQYTAENLISQREILSDQIAELLASDMERYGITIISLAVEDIDFTDAFTNAVEAKQVAAQNKLTAETQQAQKTMEEQAAAERAIIAANADAEMAKIAAQADLEVVKIQADAALYAGEREANMTERIAAALTDNLINYYWIKEWNGELPSTILGDSSNYMIDLTDR